MEGSRLVSKAADAPEDFIGGNLWRDRKKRRFLSLVFAPWVGGTLEPVEFEIRKEGIVSIASNGQDHEEQEP